jgi:hypothetical protein
MSGRRGSPSDPTSRRALESAGVEADQIRPMLEKMLQSLEPLEAGVLAMRWGLADGQFKTMDEVGKHFYVARERIRQIERRALEKLREEVSGSPLLVMDGGQVVGFVDVRRAGASPSPIDLRGSVVWCPQCHQRQFLVESGISSFGSPGTGGRRRKYCSNACRQAAYRARRAEGEG